MSLAQNATEDGTAAAASLGTPTAVRRAVALHQDYAVAGFNDLSGLVYQNLRNTEGDYCLRLREAPIISTVDGGTSPTAVTWYPSIIVA